jgi:hypothetical protein
MTNVSNSIDVSNLLIIEYPHSKNKDQSITIGEIPLALGILEKSKDNKVENKLEENEK